MAESSACALGGRRERQCGAKVLLPAGVANRHRHADRRVANRSIIAGQRGMRNRAFPASGDTLWVTGEIVYVSGGGSRSSDAKESGLASVRRRAEPAPGAVRRVPPVLRAAHRRVTDDQESGRYSVRQTHLFEGRS